MHVLFESRFELLRYYNRDGTLDYKKSFYFLSTMCIVFWENKIENKW